MPTYEYKCDNCGHQFDISQSMKDEKLTKCPDCGKNTLRRLIGSGGGLIFKGSGFYLTDYKNKPAESSSANNTSAEPVKKETTTTTTDTAKSETKSSSSETTPKKSEKKSTESKSKNEK